MGRLTRKKKRALSRRTFLKTAGLGALTPPLLVACAGSDPLAGSARPGPNAVADNPFQHGVATGDPLQDRVIFWTRLSGISADTPVTLNIYADAEASERVTQGEGLAVAARDFTVKMDQAGLAPGTTYYYQFEALGHRSVIGRTRTALAGESTGLRFGVVSCSSIAHGYFNAYRFLAQRSDVDAILHLGDYVYEYGTGEYGDVRPYEPEHEMVNLADYRTRHAYYKREPDLMELHRLFPFITIWDDHESTDNSWRDGANNHTEGAEGEWPQRKAWAQQAYDEWMPIRYPEPGNVNRIWRKFSYGNLADLFMLDTRLFDRDVPDGIPVSATGAESGRRMLGPEQLQWLLDGLAQSTAQWKIVGQQVVFHQWNLAGLPESAGGGVKLNGDSWDGYQEERAQLMAGLAGINDVVFLAGDVHSSWAANITPDPSNPLVYNPLTGDGSLAVEFVAPSVTSPFAIAIPEGQQAFQALNPHIRYTDWDRRGYLLLTLYPDVAGCQWWYVSTFEEPGGTESFGHELATTPGRNRLGPHPID